MTLDLSLTLAGMAVVTFLPRLAATTAANGTISLPSWGRKWLRGIPYAVFGALIAPGLWDSVPGAPEVGLVGIGVGSLLALARVPAFVCVLAALIAAAIWRN